MSTENTTEGDHTQELYLCSRCRTINFDHDMIKTFPLHTSDLDSSCQLCTSLQTLLSKEERSTSDKFSLVVHKGCHGRGFQTLSDDWSFKLAFLSILQPGSYLGQEITWLAEFPESSCVPSDSIPPRLVDSKRADFRLVKKWMKSCVFLHDCDFLAVRSFVPNQHVIDCSTRKIVPAPHGCAYAALSYVWGPGQTTSYHGDTLGAVPKTIEDAIQVTQILGFRYLWVDRYCILQDNAQHKMEQIHSMHRIYSNASFTIVAAAGDGPDYGLPGVSERHRCQQPRVRLGSRLMVSMSQPSKLICSSKWWTRGWTYQECMHSKRLLFFTDEQVYFQCSKNAFCESFRVPVSLGMQRDPDFGFVDRLDVWSYINQYLERTLTFPSDILNGIISVLQRFQEGQNICFRHLWGLPIIQKDPHTVCWNESFLAALLWTFGGPATRREGFPSWSWTGWFGNDLTPYEHYTHLHGVYASSWGIHLDPPKFVLETSERRRISLEDFFITSHDGETPSYVLQAEVYVVMLRLKSGKFNFRAGTNERKNMYALDPEGKLIFLAKVLKGGDFSKGSLGCRLDKAVQDSEANHLGIIMGARYDQKRETSVVFLLIVEEKGGLFERIGVCSGLLDTMLNIGIQKRPIELG